MVIALLPLTSGRSGTFQFAVPDATPLYPRSVAHQMTVTPTSSDAVPPTPIVDEVVANVDALVGAVIQTLGAVVSDGELAGGLSIGTV
jgi:hypothetical protein